MRTVAPKWTGARGHRVASPHGAHLDLDALLQVLGNQSGGGGRRGALYAGADVLAAAVAAIQRPAPVFAGHQSPEAGHVRDRGSEHVERRRQLDSHPSRRRHRIGLVDIRRARRHVPVSRRLRLVHSSASLAALLRKGHHRCRPAEESAQTRRPLSGADHSRDCRLRQRDFASRQAPD